MLRYKLLLLFLFLPLVSYTLWLSIRAFEFRYFLQRLSIFFPSKLKKNGIWIHAASVGEVNAVIPLILKIHSNHPDLTITLSSNTTSSAAIAIKQLPITVSHVYFPLDYYWLIKRFSSRIKPKAIFIVETEFWPNLYRHAAEKNIPIIIINGRISEKTLYAKTWLKKIYAVTLPLLTHVYARSDTDKQRFIELGFSPDKIDVLGNIKFSAPTTQDIKPIVLNRPYVLAASTRENEEQIIVEAWLKSEHENRLLVIVPRHPKRLSDILTELKLFSLTIAIRSKNEPVTADTDIYIADTMGELKQFIVGSEFVLMGGSFVYKGGHNILEVAQLGKAVVFGPDMRSFTDEAEMFIEKNAGIQCDIEQLPVYFTRLIHDNVLQNNIEKNTLDLINTNKNIVNDYYNVIKPYCN